LSGARYFFTIIDDFSRAVWVYLMHEKSEDSVLLQQFCSLAKIQFDKLVKTICSDNGLEFTSTPMTSFYAQHGITHQTCIVDTP